MTIFKKKIVYRGLEFQIQEDKVCANNLNQLCKRLKTCLQTA